MHPGAGSQNLLRSDCLWQPAPVFPPERFAVTVHGFAYVLSLNCFPSSKRPCLHTLSSGHTVFLSDPYIWIILPAFCLPQCNLLHPKGSVHLSLHYAGAFHRLHWDASFLLEQLWKVPSL